MNNLQFMNALYFISRFHEFSWMDFHSDKKWGNENFLWKGWWFDENVRVSKGEVVNIIGHDYRKSNVLNIKGDLSF